MTVTKIRVLEGFCQTLNNNVQNIKTKPKASQFAYTPAKIPTVVAMENNPKNAHHV